MKVNFLWILAKGVTGDRGCKTKEKAWKVLTFYPICATKKHPADSLNRPIVQWYKLRFTRRVNVRRWFNAYATTCPNPGGKAALRQTSLCPKNAESPATAGDSAVRLCIKPDVVIWCTWRDLNPHVLANIWTWTIRVCQFRHRCIKRIQSLTLTYKSPF